MGYARRRRRLRSQSLNRKPRARHPPCRLRRPCRQLQNLSVGPMRRCLERRLLLRKRHPRRSSRCPQFRHQPPLLPPKLLQQNRWRAADFRMRPHHQLRPRRAQLLQPFRTCLQPLVLRKMRLEPQEERREMGRMEMPSWQMRQGSRPGRVQQGLCLVRLLHRSPMDPHPQSHPSRNSLQLILLRTPHLRRRHPFPGRQTLRHSPRRHPRGPKYRNHLLLPPKRTRKLRPLLTSRHLP